MYKLKFEKHFTASPAKVFEVMLSSETYPLWAEVFHPGSHYDGEIKEGNIIHFVSKDSETGFKDGMVSRVEVYEPAKRVSFQHIGMVHKGEEVFEGEGIQEWVGALEEYFFEEDGQGGTLLRIETDTIDAYKDYFAGVWPKALDRLEEIVQEH